MVERFSDRNVRPALGKGDDQLDFVVHVFGLRGVRERARKVDVVRILLEEKRRFAVRIVPHFDRVRSIVAANAVDAADGKELVGSLDRCSGDRRRIDDVGRHRVISSQLKLRESVRANFLDQV